MNETQIRNIVKESIVSPSADFTNQLIRKIEKERLLAKKVKLTILLSLVLCAISMVFLFIPLPEIKWENYVIQVPIEIQLSVVIAFMMYKFYEVYGLKEQLDILNEKLNF